MHVDAACSAVASLGGRGEWGGGRTAPGDTIRGDTRIKFIFVAELIKRLEGGGEGGSG